MSPTVEGGPVAGKRLVVHGRVQGVAFRYFTQRTARRLGVVGWVRNREDGAVEAEASGPEAALEQFIEALRQGPPAARVSDLRVEELASPPRWSEFEIRY